MSKKVWEYSGKNSQGTILQGTINEESRQGAEATARRMGVINPLIIDPTDPIRQPAGDPVPYLKAAEQLKEHILPAAPTFKQIPSKSEKKLNEMVAGMADNVERHIAETRIRQTLLIGDEPKVMANIEPLLSGGGHVLSVNMHPNHNGIMIFAIVIEHAEKEKK